jgi:hypothetical protein
LSSLRQGASEKIDERAVSALKARGLPEFLAQALGGLQQAIDEGRLARVTDTIARLTGTAPAALEALLKTALR